MDSAKGNTGEREREREKGCIFTALWRGNSRTRWQGLPLKSRETSAVRYPGAFSRRCTQTGNAPGGWHPLMHFPALGSHAFGKAPSWFAIGAILQQNNHQGLILGDNWSP